MLPPATWYPDPSGRHEHRYWDGSRWTEHVADAGIAAIDRLPTVTADEQVDGGLAADIAAVAMAATSTTDEPGDRADGGDDATPRRRRTDRRGRASDDAPAAAPTGDQPVPDHPAAEEPADDDADPWTRAASTWFVMPPETIASLAEQAQGAATSPTFSGLDVDGADVGAVHGVARSGDGITVVVADGPHGVLVATRWLRRVIGTCDLDAVTPRWARRVVGDATVTLLPGGASTVVTPVGVDRVLVRSDAFVATDGAAGLSRATGAGAVGDTVAVSGAAWLVITAPDRATVVAVDDAGRRLPVGHVVAWTDGLELVPEGAGVVLVRGSGSVLLDGPAPD